jgi:hypothetical protein
LQSVNDQETARMANPSEIYRITFLNKGKVYEVFAKQVYQSELYGFIEVEDYIFDERSQVVVDPSEEKLKAEFLGVKRSFIPIQAIVRIDEVEKGGVSKITSGDNITLFPVPYMTARNTDTQKSE